MTTKELWKARALYIGHLLATGVCFGLLVLFADRLGLTAYHATFGEVVLFFAYLAAGTFAAQLVLAPLFRRKARAWQMLVSIPSEDRWPRR